MENQVLSIEQMQELKALGIDTSSASMFWHPAFYRASGVLDYDGYEDIPRIKLENNYNLEYDILTFTLQDILNILPKKVIDKLTNVPTGLVLIRSMEQDWWKISYQFEDIDEFIQATPTFKGNNPLELAFNLLKWCKQNGCL